MAQLEDLRKRIRELDAELLKLVAARMETAKAIGQQKKLEGIALRDWNVERQVLDRAARQADQLGLPQKPVRALMRLLIAASRDEQERLSYSDYRGTAENILIIGGAGAMGRWFADFFGNQGHRVSIRDPQVGTADTALAAALDETSCTLIATPLDVAPEVVEQITTTGYGGVVFDIASLKSHLKPAIARARAAGVALTSVHPMFGPGTRTLSDQVICICDCGDAGATRKVEAFFADTAATLVKLSLDEHDRIVSYVLGLSHLTNIVFTKVLMASGLPFERINQVGSTTFQSQMVTTETVIRENPDLYYAIQKLNPFSAELRESFRCELETISGWIRDEDAQAFRAMMQRGEKWIAGDDAD
jgi:chorismate mutase/prephenate dehydrogenase